MAAKYRKVDTRIWADEKFRSWDAETRWVWMYLLTSDQTNRVGLFRFSAAKASEDTGVSMASVRRSIDVLERSGSLFQEAEMGLLWLPNWLRYNQPAGTNQLDSLLTDFAEFPNSKMAKVARCQIKILRCTSPGEESPITKRHAVFIRDSGECSYCKKIIEAWSDYQMDHAVPKSKEPGDRYERLVCACEACNTAKGSKTADEFGFPFVSGREYSIREALFDLLANKTIRGRVKTACRTLPAIIEEIPNEILEKYSIAAAFGRRLDGDETPFAQEQDQEQKQKQKNGAAAAADVAGVLIPKSIDTNLFRESWSLWLAYRSDIKKNYKSIKSVEMQLNKLAKFSPEVASESIKISIASGWQGLFPEKVSLFSDTTPTKSTTDSIEQRAAIDRRAAEQRKWAANLGQQPGQIQ